MPIDSVSPDWLLLIERLGFPGALIVAAIVGVWRGCHFLAPIIHRVTDRHVQLIDTISEQSTRQTACLEQFGEVQKSHGTILESHGRILGEHGELLREIRDGIA